MINNDDGYAELFWNRVFETIVRRKNKDIERFLFKFK